MLVAIEETKALVLRAVTLINEGNIDALDDCFAATFADHPLYPAVVSPGYVPGPALLKQALVGFRAALPDMRWTVDHLLAEGDRVLLVYTLTGTHQGTIYGVPATGKQITYVSVSIFRIEDGKIAEEWRLYDRASVWQQLGLIPPTREIIPAP
jgi:steroid delta-isomerase-like uncharacterized protein